MASQVDADAVADAAHLLRTLSAELSIKHLSTIAHENAQLKKELQNVVAENSGAMRSIQRLRGEVDSTETRLKESDAKLQELRKEKARLSAGLEAAQNALEASKKEVKNLEAKFMKDQESIAKELNDKALELERLQGFIFELKPVSDSKTRKDITTGFDAIYSSARKLADTYFGGELPPDILEKESTWAQINAVNIPLPVSNSPIAKQMRVAAVLSILGQELCSYIFQPTYLLKDSTSLNETLDSLARLEPELESHLRSVLLTASVSGVDDDDPVDLACMNTVFESVHPRLSKLVPKEKQKEFKTELQDFVNKVSKEWSFMQKLDDKVVSSLGSNLESKMKYKWKPLVFDSPSLPPTNPKQRANGTAPSQTNPKTPPAAGPKAQVDTAANLMKGIAVWPAFHNLSSDNAETLAEGFILPPASIKAAEEEQQKLLEQKMRDETQKENESNGSSQGHREDRAKRRASVAAKNGQEGRFFSKGSGGGGKGS